MLLLFSRSVLSVCRGSRCRVQQGCFIGHSVNIWLYCLSFFIGRVCVCPIPAHNECMASERCCEFDHIRILLDPVVDIHQGWSILRFGALHKRGYVYPAVVRLYLQLEIRPIWTRDCTGFIPAFRVSVEYILSRKENSASNLPCLNKAFLSSFTELSDFCKCLCHS